MTMIHYEIVHYYYLISLLLLLYTVVNVFFVKSKINVLKKSSKFVTK